MEHLKLEELKCVKCDLFLSCAPILLNVNGDNICGRCQNTNGAEEFTIRNKSFEAVAAILSFPCRYLQDGCLQLLNWKTVLGHEQNCVVRPYKCPINPKTCDWKGNSSEFIQHCDLSHENSILNKPYMLMFDLSKNEERNMLIKAYNFMFLLQFKIDMNQGKMWICVRYIGHEKFISQYYCSIKISRNSTHLSDIVKIQPQDEDFEIIEIDSYECSISGLETVLKGTDNITIVFVINKKLNFHLLEEVKCIICSCYTKPPIYKINNDTVCSKCAPTNCKEQIDFTQMGYQQLYPCAHRSKGCSYFNSLKDLWKHEIFFCNYFNCCVCQTVNNISIEAHFQTKHTSLMYTLEEILNIECNTGLYWLLIQYNTTMFICRYKFYGSQVDFFLCSNILADEIDKYSCDLKIIDFKTKKSH